MAESDDEKKPSMLARWKAMQKENMAKDTSVSAFLANGLDELRQAAQPGFSTQVGAGNSPGVWGTITTGEATAERLEGQTMDVPSMKPAAQQVAEMAPEAQQEAKAVGKSLGEQAKDAWYAMLGKPVEQEQQQTQQQGRSM